MSSGKVINDIKEILKLYHDYPINHSLLRAQFRRFYYTWTTNETYGLVEK